MQGRVFTLVGSMSSAAFPLSLAIAGPLADAVGVRPWYVVGGAVSAILGLGACFVPVIVNVENNGHDAAKIKQDQEGGRSAADGRATRPYEGRVGPS
jgi:DHA3 family macrolide efflux protein-like MFS transporter